MMRIGLGLLLVGCLVLPTMAQVSPSRYRQPDPKRTYQPPARSPVNQQPRAGNRSSPTLQRRKPQPPFQLTAQEEAWLDRVLTAWEQRGDRVKKFECRFTRWTLGPSNPKPTSIDQGVIKYAAPDKGLFLVDDGTEHWLCDGKSIFQYDKIKKQVIERQLPPELHGEAITEGPLPFLFGAKAKSLKQRYFLRVVTPVEKQRKEIWLQAYPRFQQQAAEILSASVILKLPDLQPIGVQLLETNGKEKKIYKFQDQKVNANNTLQKLDLLHVLTEKDPFKMRVPSGWKHVVRPPSSQLPASQARHPRPMPRR